MVLKLFYTKTVITIVKQKQWFSYKIIINHSPLIISFSLLASVQTEKSRA